MQKITRTAICLIFLHWHSTRFVDAAINIFGFGFVVLPIAFQFLQLQRFLLEMHGMFSLVGIFIEKDVELVICKT